MTPDNKIHVFFNRSKSTSRWIRVKLEGVKNLKMAQDVKSKLSTTTDR